MRWILLVGCALLLVSCGSEQYGDLKQELAQISKKLPHKIPPLPVVKPYQAVPYDASDLPDPFGPAKIALVAKSTPGTSKFRPDANRPKEPLEAYPLESLKMVGELQSGKQTYGIVKADSTLYRVKVGNYMGQNFGRITKITENEIDLRELVQDASGDWNERTSSLQLQEASK